MLQRPVPRLILASASESRRALLASAGLTFAVCPADLDEGAMKRSALSEDISAEAAALRLAEAKAAAVAEIDPEALVIGADQILVCNGIWFDKPADPAAAGTQLQALRGRVHRLATAVICRRGGTTLWSHSESPNLTRRDFSDSFVDAYLQQEGEAVTRTVGAYRMEGPGIHLFAAIDGEHSAILGLPLLPLVGFLRGIGVLVR